MLFLRSLVFALGQWFLTPIFAIAGLFTLPFPLAVRYKVITTWTRLVIAWSRLVCGVNYRVIGLEHLPNQPAIIMAKHQSAWETMAFQCFLPPQVWVLKRELLKIPFFGWGLAMLAPIAIDRSAGRAALKQMGKEGRDRLDRGFWIVIFPEGTRVPFGEQGEYQIGGAWLAHHCNAPIVPIAHNAGSVWPRNAFLKHPGEITVSIGPVIQPDGRKPGETLAAVEAWIEAECARIGSARAPR